MSWDEVSVDRKIPNAAHLQGRVQPKGVAKSSNALFLKTKMCSFFLKGSCKRESCTFAHGAEELSARPDLRCTKMCAATLRGGICMEADCPFAHHAGEVRSVEGVTSVPPVVPSTVTDAQGGARFMSSGCRDTRPVTDDQAVYAEESSKFGARVQVSSMVLEVRNTFLEVREEKPGSQARSRSV